MSGVVPKSSHIILQDHLWLLGLIRCKPNGGSIAGTLCVLLPCQLIDVTCVDVGHPVVQVSGAADHVGDDLLLGN